MGKEVLFEDLKGLFESMKNGEKIEIRKSSGKLYIVGNNSSEEINCIIQYLNKITEKDFREKSKSTRRHINARLQDGFTFEDFQMVIEFKSAQWKNDSKMNEYLRPSTLFNSKFEGYLQAAKHALKNNIKPKPFNESRSEMAMNKMLEMENPYAQ